MRQQEIETRLKQIAREICSKLEEGEIDPTLGLTAQGMDSLDGLDYVLAVESEFDIEVDNDSFDEAELGKIANMARYLVSKGA